MYGQTLPSNVLPGLKWINLSQPAVQSRVVNFPGFQLGTIQTLHRILTLEFAGRDNVSNMRLLCQLSTFVTWVGWVTWITWITWVTCVNAPHDPKWDT